jgi:hypothetical protein
VNGGFTLAYNGFYDDGIKTGSLTKRYGFTRFFRATPPNVSPEADGRISILSFTNSSIRVYHLKLPCEIVLLGSTASTATFP